MMNLPILSIIVWLPILGAIIMLCIPQKEDKLVKVTAAFFATLTLILSIAVFVLYDRTKGGLQFAENFSWIKPLGINYNLAVDGLSLPMVLLTAIILFSGVFVSWKIKERSKEFFFYMFMIVGGVFGFYMSRDLFAMFLFLEVSVIPKFILIDIWGSKNKEYAALKYTLYLLAGSAIALVGAIAIHLYALDPVKGLGISTFNIDQLALVKYDPNFQKFAFLLLLMGFGIFVPMWPAHRWTPDGHSAAPTAISMLLAGVIMKLGGYALIRVGIYFFPVGAKFWAPVIAVIATINAVYVAFVAMAQKDVKYMVANSSVSHMGYVLIGVASLNAAAIDGAAAQMFAHGIMAALFFAVVGNIYDKAHTRIIEDFGGLAHQVPRLAAAFLIAGLASLGLPGMFNFVAEFSIFVGSIQVFPALAVISIFAVVVTAIYVLRVMQKMFYGPRNPKWDHLQDAKGVEMIPIVLLTGVLIIFGVFPHLIVGLVNGSVAPIAQKILTIGVGGIF